MITSANIFICSNSILSFTPVYWLILSICAIIHTLICLSVYALQRALIVGASPKNERSIFFAQIRCISGLNVSANCNPLPYFSINARSTSESFFCLSCNKPEPFDVGICIISFNLFVSVVIITFYCFLKI